MKRILALYFVGNSIYRPVVGDETVLQKTLDEAMLATTVTLIKVGGFKFSIRHFVGYEFYDEQSETEQRQFLQQMFPGQALQTAGYSNGYTKTGVSVYQQGYVQGGQTLYGIRTKKATGTRNTEIAEAGS